MILLDLAFIVQSVRKSVSNMGFLFFLLTLYILYREREIEGKRDEHLDKNSNLAMNDLDLFWLNAK